MGSIQGAHPTGFCAIVQGRIWAFAKRIRMAYSGAASVPRKATARVDLAGSASLERSAPAPGHLPAVLATLPAGRTTTLRAASRGHVAAAFGPRSLSPRRPAQL